MRRGLDLWLVCTLAGVGAIAQWYPLPAIARGAAGLALVALCPGYALVAALFPGQRPGWPERAALSLGLSLALAALGTVALNQTPWGLQAGAWAGLLGGLTLAGSLIAAARRAMASPVLELTRRQGRALRLPHLAMLGLAALLTTAALALTRAPQPATDVEGYTVLWLAPVAGSGAPAVRLGVDSNEFEATSYSLTLTEAGRPVEAWPNLTLAPGDQWEQVVELPAGEPGEAVEARLYRLDDPGTLYRWVRWWRSDTTG
jgi:hypothetical protein